jgi:1-acylglycerone phosphate reductase
MEQNRPLKKLLGPIGDASYDQIQRVFETNVFSAIRLGNAVIPSMAKRRKGLIVNVGSVVADAYVIVYPSWRHMHEVNDPIRPAPWNGLYCASKAALHSITEVLSMECRHIGVDVMLLSPASVKSNMSSTEAKTFSIPESSLWSDYLENMMGQLQSVERPETMPTNVFAEKVVKKILTNAPPTYVTEGGGWMTFSVLRWLPRSWVLWYMGRAFSGKA